MITWEGKPKDQKLPSGHLLKDIIRSSELDLILPSQTLYPLHIRLWPLQWSSSLCPFIYLNRGRASSTGMKGKPKGHLSPCQGLTVCLPVIYHTLPLRPDQRGRLTVTSAHALPASPAPPHPTKAHQRGFLGRDWWTQKLKGLVWHQCWLVAFMSLPHLICKHLGKNLLWFK